MVAADEFELNLSDAELEAYRDAAKPMRHVRDISEYFSDVIGPRFFGVEKNPGDLLPWDKASRIGFRPGETTLWMGISGHGKSALASQAALWWALQGKPSCIASFEMLPAALIDRMLLQAAGNANPSEDFSFDFMGHLRGKILIYDRRDTVNVDTLYRVIRYCALERGVKHFWIDSLMKCVRGEDDYNGQKNLMDTVCTMGRELMIHTHVIHHVRKGEDESRAPGKFDAKGTGAITDLVDQVIAVWRNKRLEAEIADGAGDPGAPGFMMICDKNRHGSWEGKVPLWGDASSWHFRGTSQQPWTRGYDIPKRVKEAA
jgi:twinkle protein